VSEAGDPLQTFPPSVPRIMICVEPNVAAASASAVYSFQRSSDVASA